MALELQVLHKNRNEAGWDAIGDPRDPSWIQEQLHNWLSSNGWHKGRWSEFEMVARQLGDGRVRGRVRG